MRIIVLDERRLVREVLVRALCAAGMDATGADSESALFAEVGLRDAELVLIGVSGASDVADDRWQLSSRVVNALPGARVVVTCDLAVQAQLAERALGLGVRGLIWTQHASVPALVEALRRVAKGELRVQVAPAAPVPRASPSGSALARWRLTGRELEVLALLRVGRTNAEIATHLGITERTVRAHVSGLYRKSEAENRTELALISQGVPLPQPVAAQNRQAALGGYSLSG